MPIASVDSNDSTAVIVSPMATLTIRNLKDTMKEEVRQILRQVVKPADAAATSEGLDSRIHNHFAWLGGAELELPSRSDTPAAPDLVNAHPRFSHQRRE